MKEPSLNQELFKNLAAVVGPLEYSEDDLREHFERLASPPDKECLVKSLSFILIRSPRCNR